MKAHSTKRVPAFLLAVLMMISLLPTAALAADEEPEEVTPVVEEINEVVQEEPAETEGAAPITTVAKIGTTEYATLEDAIDAAATGDTITLLADVTASDEASGMFWFMGKTGNFTLDCNGHTITGGITDGYYGSANVTINGYKSVETTYTKTAGGQMKQFAAVWAYRNNFVITGGEFTATNAVVMQYNGTVELQDGTYIMKGEDGPVVLSLGGKTTIRKGTYKGVPGLTKVCAICAANNGTVDVYGGTFEGYLEEQDNGKITIYGGTFSVDPSAYVASGYEAKANGTSPETWTVTELPKNFFADDQGVYHIANLDGLKEFRNDINKAGNETKYSGKTVVLDADIDMLNELWTPITAHNEGLTLDGGNHTIKNLKVSLTGDVPAGLIGDGTSVTVKDLTIAVLTSAVTTMLLPSSVMPSAPGSATAPSGMP